MPANPPTKQAARLPKAKKARIMFSGPNHATDSISCLHGKRYTDEWTDSVYPVVTIQVDDSKQARALIRVAGFFAMGEAEQIQSLRRLFMEVDAGKAPYTATAKAVLTLIASGGARK